MDVKYITANTARNMTTDLSGVRRIFSEYLSKIESKISKRACLSHSYLRTPIQEEYLGILKLHYSDLGFKVEITQEVWNNHIARTMSASTYYWVIIIWDEAAYRLKKEES